ncbi:ExeA family protein [Azotobacter beijerinckii]|uniref:General secretion pathway protein A n=1 Tax=Azotobacter beijerinckii TaxID=170623 RepID=A0A1I4D0D8_9GAMM|nr:ExeA family protein [Azotobacter beijerinckii]SFB55827.1 general secretion pathway protein A [Azotobacter beijerinckii]SFK86159.1 general secretion pathway protein A [Azotobacter beijerinckii]
MYNPYFGFSEAPFSISPDPRYLFMSERHREALAHLLYGLQIDGGFVLLTGEVGTGKTTLCRCLLEQVPEHCDIAFIFNPKLTRQELLKTLCEELHIVLPDGIGGLKALFDRLNAHLLQSNAKGRKTVLIVDEAQNLSAEVLELLRLLTNLETHRHKLLQIILLGQTELRDIVAREDMRQLAQRIVARYHLEPLSRPEVGAYVRHRLAVAGTRAVLFPPPLLERLYRLSGGTPRLINVLCDRALLGAYVQGKAAVDRPTLESAAREVFGPDHRSRTPAAVAAALGVTLLAGLATAGWQLAPAPLFAAGRGALDSRLAAAPLPADATPPPSSVPSPLPATGVPDRDEKPVQPPPPTPTATPTQEHEPPPEPSLEPPAPEPLEPPDEDVAGPATKDHWLHEAQAVRALFGHWQAAIRQPSDLDGACRQVEEMSLRCLRQQVDPQSLASLPPPLILELSPADGPPFLATLLARDKGQARLVVAGEVREVALAALQRRWSGRYVLLQQAPLARSRRLSLGTRGADVAWVDLQLARWEGLQQPRAGDPLFGTELERRVRSFQQAHGLLADGVVGTQTLERLAQLGTTEMAALAR